MACAMHDYKILGMKQWDAFVYFFSVSCINFVHNNINVKYEGHEIQLFTWININSHNEIKYQGRTTRSNGVTYTDIQLLNYNFTEVRLKWFNWK